MVACGNGGAVRVQERANGPGVMLEGWRRRVTRGAAGSNAVRRKREDGRSLFDGKVEVVKSLLISPSFLTL